MSTVTKMQLSSVMEKKLTVGELQVVVMFYKLAVLASWLAAACWLEIYRSLPPQCINGVCWFKYIMMACYEFHPSGLVKASE